MVNDLVTRLELLLLETEPESEVGAKDVQDAQAKRKFTKEELELARQIYGKSRYYVHTAPGMLNQIYRNGLLPKKTLDGDGYTRMHGSKNYYREYVLSIFPWSCPDFA